MPVFQASTAGNPREETVRGTDRTVGHMRALRQRDDGITVSTSVARPLLQKHRARRRTTHKRHTRQAVPHRHAPFDNMPRLKDAYEATGHPIVSLDTKQKESLGHGYRAGQV